jgi:3-deoxy-manno-octulosonate cytidylyltransferase (CMP-KDO synthetase)
LDLGGKPVVQHVWERAKKVKQSERVVIVTDAEEVAQVARNFGAEVLMTSPDCPSGTARISSVLDKLEGDFFINIQGDEPFIDPVLLDDLITCWKKTQCSLVTAVSKITQIERLQSPNVVKVVRAENGEALYFSRSAIPFFRGKETKDWLNNFTYWSHIGVYGYNRAALARYPQLSATALESVESLEQLRFLAHGYKFQTIETHYHPVAIDTADDLEAARKLLK